MLAMHKSGSTDSQTFKSHIEDIANAPGEKIYPGELGKALDMIAAGKDIDYVGASAVELVNGGESAGNYREIEVQNGKNVTVNFR
jgi:branched-chain amino acid transport system substrate-binding protein